MYKTYTIGEMARMLGVTAETIRYYERKNIIRPIHNEESGYRYYTTWDLHMIIRARCYLGFGFTIEETADILQKENIGEIDDVLSRREEVLQQNIIYQMNLLKKLRTNRMLIRDSKEQPHPLSMQMSPAMYRINTQVNYELILSKEAQEEIRKMCEKVPFVFSTALFRKEDIEAGKTDFDFGIGIEEQFARLLDVRPTDRISYYPSRLCLYICVPSRSSWFLTYHVLQPAFDYMKENNLQLSGDVVTQIVAMCRPEEEYFNWHNVWIPVE